ncbi:MAG: efflux RND transporter permease subunit [Thermoanaerobaculia bacterium]|nr:efflux RND transporter permease subunit [Thermoanaerobaculia bacterium]
MKLIEGAIQSPVKTAVGVIFVVLFGAIGLYFIPVQLTPTVEEPKVSVQTVWPGASPAEIEREIIDEQEEQLKSLDGLVKMESSSSDSFGSITLTFDVGSDADTNLLKVSNRLEQVPQYPADAEKPVILLVDPNQGAMAWYLLTPWGDEPFQGDIATLYNFVEDEIKPQLERVSGVAQSNFFGGQEGELQVIVDPAELAARQVTMNQLAAALDRENRNFSGGDFPEGKRRYVVRTVGEYASPEDVEDVVITMRNGVPIYVKNVAEVKLGYRKAQAEVYFQGTKIVAINVIREPGANVLRVMEGVEETVAALNAGVLADRGLRLEHSFDETTYIESAISLVQQSLMIGGVLAIAVLLLFLRSRASTLVVAVAIPISIVGAFVVLWLLGRTLNVISLAGMAFAVGMVVDNAIVVLENIYRHRQMGKRRFRAALEGTKEVWGAVLASTLTTIAVFLPIIFVEEEAGQLFRDIALAISSAVGLSLAVSITVIPSLSAKILDAVEVGADDREGKSFSNLWGMLTRAERANDWITGRVGWIIETTPRRLAVVVGFTVASIGLAFLLAPKAEYLPQGNQNFVFGFVVPPPGYNLQETASYKEIYEDELRHLWETPPEEAIDLPGGGVDDFWFVALTDRVFFGVSARDETRAGELVPEINRINGELPGAFGFASQWSLFSSGIGEGRNIDVELSGPDLERLIELGGRVIAGVGEHVPGAQAIPVPSLDLGNPEVHVVPHRRRAAELGISNRDLGFTVSALVDGAKASDYQDRGREIDLKVMADESFAHRTHLLEQMPIATPDGRLVTLASVADIEVARGPVQINHRERQRTITIQVTPPEEMALQAAMETIESEVLAPLAADGSLGGLYQAHLSGTADKLTQTRRALQWNLLLALVITYLLLAALFESFLYPFVIMFSVPLAAFGGFLGLAVLNLFSYNPLDVLTMLGFVILIGTVVNNAILIVHQSLNHMRDEGMETGRAIRNAVSNRIRPIFMSVGTSVFGMLPLVLFPGAGSELYRGLGSVVVGGLVVSTVFTLFLVPALFSLVLEARRRLADRFGHLVEEKEGAEAVGF